MSRKIKVVHEYEATVPNGYEEVSNVLSYPRKGELYVFDGKVVKATDDFKCRKYLIVRKVWEWPAQLTCDWAVKSTVFGAWYIGNGPLPQYKNKAWDLTVVNAAVIATKALKVLGIEMPDCEAKYSLRINPSKSGS